MSMPLAYYHFPLAYWCAAAQKQVDGKIIVKIIDTETPASVRVIPYAISNGHKDKP